MANKTIDQYIETFPADVQKKLQKIRRIIQKAAPGTTESISYGIPTFKLDGKYVIYFAGYKNHISVHPIGTGEAKEVKEISKYLSGKGTAKFPLENPIPYDLIQKLAMLKMKKRLKEQRKGDK